MRSDYWHPLFASVTSIEVSFLSSKAVRRLLTQPNLDFPLKYTNDALDLIASLTSGQPYLTQLIGHYLISYFNEQSRLRGAQRETTLTVEDVRVTVDIIGKLLR
jgi:hypothetical protein